jgi:hypothetical protein
VPPPDGFTVLVLIGYLGIVVGGTDEVGVRVGVCVGVCVAVLVAVGDVVPVGLLVAVGVTVGVSVLVGVGVGVRINPNVAVTDSRESERFVSAHGVVVPRPLQ